MGTYYEPKLIRNSESHNTKVISELEKCFRFCDSFSISVAFINKGGLAAIKQVLLDLEKQGVKGRIITSTYLNFNEPNMFRELLRFNNIETRIFEGQGFHPKGYLFKNYQEKIAIVGSSNITQNALTINEEWNIELRSLQEEIVVDTIYDEFEEQWSKATPLTLEWINKYEENYVRTIPSSEQLKSNKEFKPNLMQEEALLSLKELREKEKDKALLISATGTGKTFLSAFDVEAFNAKRMLFVVHRENIARKALSSFKEIMPNKTYGIFTGISKEADKEYIFSTIQTISKEEYYTMFERDYFDYIIIDEVHHAGAGSYQELLSYFKPKFLLGMTATPERTDGFDIYKLFDYNVAYEIRLKDAMEYDLLCPFHYYGISDISIDDNEDIDYQDFNKIEWNNRVDHIVDTIEKYNYSGSKVHGLIFVNRKDVAHRLSDDLNTRGYKTVALTGEDSEEKRKENIDLLESNDINNCLDYIITVDIFNEGVDIPSINQVVMVRPTESAIIFVQQLGRGLRKDDNKDYANIIDIVGNYDKNFLIPIALSGSNAYNKDNLRRFLFDSNLEIPGASTISFDEITKKRIYESIDKANFSEIKLIKESYKLLKMKLGRIPKLIEFDKYNSIDPLRIFDNNSLGSYHKFLKKYENDYNIDFSETKMHFLEYISTRFAAGKRIHELELLKQIIDKKESVFDHLRQSIENNYSIKYDNKINKTLVNEFTQNFITGSGKNKYSKAIFIEEDGNDYRISEQFDNCLKDNNFYNQVLDLIDFGIHRYLSEYSNRYNDTDLCLYAKYTYDDVCKLLNWEKSEVALNIGGYKYDKYSNTFPIFINYEKGEVQATINYQDRFLDNSHLIEYSKSNRTIESDDIQRLLNAETNNMPIHIFVRKNKDDKNAKEFYYLGTANVDKTKELKQLIMPGTNSSAVEIPLLLHNPVIEDLYEYIIG